MTDDLEPATETQKQYAHDLGLSFPPDITSSALASLISARVGGLATPEQKAAARKVGLWYSKLTTYHEMEELLGDFAIARCWVYSVIRHLARAAWTKRRECTASRTLVRKVAVDIVADIELMGMLRQQPKGDPDESFLAAMAQFPDDEFSEWYFFHENGRAPASRLYAATVQGIREALKTESPGAGS